jgi:S-formylglutathione hydrolase FrmB
MGARTPSFGQWIRRAGTAGVAMLTLAACTSSARPSRPSPTPSRTPAPAVSTASGSPRPNGAASESARVQGLVNGSRKDRYGRVVRVDIPASDGFRPRPAFLYLPRVLKTHPGVHLPVLELLHGTPGQPADWLTSGNLLATADAFAAAHHGAAPVIVVPDINGSRRADSECVRTATGVPVERYLTEDVVRFVRTRVRPNVGTRRWWVAGLSEGGLCAANLALRHPALYSAFGDMSGLARPIVEHMTQAASDRQLFGDDVAARLEHDPVWLLRHRRYPRLHAWLVCGDADLQVRRAQATLVDALRAAHVPVVAGLRPGKHVWPIWSSGLREVIPWFWRHAPS